MPLYKVKDIHQYVYAARTNFLSGKHTEPSCASATLKSFHEKRFSNSIIIDKGKLYISIKLNIIFTGHASVLIDKHIGR